MLVQHTLSSLSSPQPKSPAVMKVKSNFSCRNLSLRLRRSMFQRLGRRLSETAIEVPESAAAIEGAATDMEGGGGGTAPATPSGSTSLSIKQRRAQARMKAGVSRVLDSAEMGESLISGSEGRKHGRGNLRIPLPPSNTIDEPVTSESPHTSHSPSPNHSSSTTAHPHHHPPHEHHYHGLEDEGNLPSPAYMPSRMLLQAVVEKEERTLRLVGHATHLHQGAKHGPRASLPAGVVVGKQGRGSRLHGSVSGRGDVEEGSVREFKIIKINFRTLPGRGRW